MTDTTHPPQTTHTARACDSLRIGVLGHYGNNNLGDEAIVQAVLENLRLRVPGAELVCFSSNPANTHWRHGVAAHPVSRKASSLGVNHPPPPAQPTHPPAHSADEQSPGLKERLKAIPGLRSSYRFARKAAGLPSTLLKELLFIRQSRQQLLGIDLLLVAGSNPFLDNFGGVWAFPYAMLKWAWLARLAGCKVAFVSVGAGPIASAWSFFFIRCALRAAHLASFRDEASRQLVACRWAGHGAAVMPDLAFSLLISPNHRPTTRRHPVIGLNPMPVHDPRYWHEPNPHAYRVYVQQLAAFCALMDAAGCDWFMYATQPKDGNVMVDVMQHLKRFGHTPSSNLEQKLFMPPTVNELVQRLGETDVLVATRFHGVVLSLLAGRPALGLRYHRKTGDVLDLCGLADFHIHMDAIDAETLMDMLHTMIAQQDALQIKVQQTARHNRQQLAQQYEALLDLVPDARTRGSSKAQPCTGSALETTTATAN
ncbi:polysaccharide pyruvyl transferase family protein [Hydrogenophaga sp.]|uniref:polysaccharide pyruvyl transferase family protein n=1 Tax=Hydrogenophaga sp. TaxID=1904254 RepID=UPI003F6AC7B5